MILDLLFPAYRGKSLLRKGGLIASLVSFGLMFPFGFTIGMKATWIQLSACFLLMGLLILISLRLPRMVTPLENSPKPARFFWIALLGSFLFWLVYLIVPLLIAPALISWFLAMGLIGFYMAFLNRLDRLGERFDPARKSRFILGTMILWFFFDVAVRYSPDHAGDPVQGLILFSGLYMVMLIILVWKNKPVPAQ
jgi:hypothetical protein